MVSADRKSMADCSSIPPFPQGFFLASFYAAGRFKLLYFTVADLLLLHQTCFCQSKDFREYVCMYVCVRSFIPLTLWTHFHSRVTGSLSRPDHEVVSSQFSLLLLSFICLVKLLIAALVWILSTFYVQQFCIFNHFSDWNFLFYSEEDVT